MSEAQAKIVAGCIAGLIAAVIVIAARAVVLAVIWGWAVPYVFSGAVEAGMLPASLTFNQGLTLSILLWALGMSLGLKLNSK